MSIVPMQETLQFFIKISYFVTLRDRAACFPGRNLAKADSLPYALAGMAMENRSPLCYNPDVHPKRFAESADILMTLLYFLGKIC